MQTQISATFQQYPHIKEAETILRACVHCGFCTATCPTYQLLGDELDGPRGRIYLIKQLLEGGKITQKTQTHLDRCLTCRSCETTCPSGVRYGRLAEIGREIVEQKIGRNWWHGLQRKLLRMVIPYNHRFRRLLVLARVVKPILPAKLQQKIPIKQALTDHASQSVATPRTMIVLQGCAQSVVTPNTNSAATAVLAKLGITLVTAESAGCCGAVSHHLCASEDGLQFMRRNIDAWWPLVEKGAEAVVITASGCGAMVKEYGLHLQHDPHYATKAARISELTKDISEVVQREDISVISAPQINRTVAFHSPCTLQHGQKLAGVVETLLTKVGYKLVYVQDNHLCCGSAGTYSILQPQLSRQLLQNKLSALQQQQPDIIATANIGCQMHLATEANVPVCHWIELL